MEAIHRLAPGTFDGTYAFFERDVHEEDRPRVVQAIKDALQTGKPYWVRYRVIPGQQREDCWIEASGQVIFEQGVAVRMLGICHEVTERIRLQEELRSRAKQQEALAQLGERALTETDIERLLNDVVSTVALHAAGRFRQGAGIDAGRRRPAAARRLRLEARAASARSCCRRSATIMRATSSALPFRSSAPISMPRRALPFRIICTRTAASAA